jgi:prophage tail gpP-like protein
MPPEPVTISVGGQQYGFWHSIEITVGLDTVDTIALSAPFEPERAEFREIFRPFSFPEIKAWIGEVLLFTGTLVDVAPRVEAETRTVEVSGYGKPGVLGDCTLPASVFPMEFKGAGLREIALSICAPFGIDVDYRMDDDAPFDKIALVKATRGKRGGKRARWRDHSFDKVAIEHDTKPWEFLAKLAKQRGAVLTSSSSGKLLIWRAVPTEPVVSFESGKPPLGVVEPEFNPQEYYSEITGYAPTKAGRKGSKYTARNERLSGITRPHCFTCSDSEDADVPDAAAAKLGRMFGAAARFKLTGLPTWRDPNGALWHPNTTTSLLAPSAMVYRATDLIIRTATFRQTGEKQDASLTLTFPGAFGGEAPESFPWDP